jgi:type I restriction enzyme S subunit
MELKKGYKQTEVGLIPDEWKIMTIDQIFEFHSTSNYSKAQMLTDGEIGCFHYGLIHSIPNTNYDIQNGVKYFVTKQQAKYEFIKEGDVVMVDASEDLSGVNKSIEISGVDDKLYISGLHTFLLRDRGFFEKYFRGSILNSYLTKAQFYRLAVGMKVFGVSKQQLKTVLLPIPTKSEQTAIASALSDADAYIKSLEKLIEKKYQIKQGAMQELLKPKDGWEVKKLGELCNKITTGKLDANAMNPDGEYRFYTCARDFSYIDQYAFDDEVLLISGNGENVGYVHYYNGKFNAYQRTYILSGFKVNIQFIKLYLDKFLEIRIRKEVNLGNTPYIKMDTLTDMEIFLPPKEVQGFISEKLIDLDNELKSLSIKLYKAKAIKQGMMQNLLTGKIRLL